MSSAFRSTALCSWVFGNAGRFSASRMNFLMGRRMTQVMSSAHRKVNSAMPTPQVLRSHEVSSGYFTWKSTIWYVTITAKTVIPLKMMGIRT